MDRLYFVCAKAPNQRYFYPCNPTTGEVHLHLLCAPRYKKERADYIVSRFTELSATQAPGWKFKIRPAGTSFY